MSDVPDKGYLYGKFQQSRDWRDNLAKLVAHKAVDVGVEEDVHVDNSRQTSGMGWKELAVIAATGLGGAWVYTQANQPRPTPQTDVQQSVAPGPIDSEYEIRFFDKDGNLITVPHISQMPAGQP